MLFIVIPLLLLFLILLSQDLLLGILLTIVALPSYLIRFSVFGIPTTFLEILFLLVVLRWIVYRRKFIFERLTSFRHIPLCLPIFLFLLSATIGLFIAPDTRAAFGVFKAYYLEPICFLFILFDLSRDHHTNLQEKIFRAFGFSAILISIFGIVQFLFNIGIPIPWDSENRITSIFEYPNALALFLEPIIVLSWFQIVKTAKETKENKKRSRDLWFWILVSTLATINVFLAQSEEGIASLVVTALCILLFSKITRRQTIVSLLLVGTLVFTIPTSRMYLMEKITFQDSSELVRLSQWKETVSFLKDHPLFGAGLSGYPILLKPYHQDLQYEIFQYPHNIILNIWVELGLLGLVAIFLFAIQLVRIMIQIRYGTHGYLQEVPLQRFSLTNSTTHPLFFFVFLEIFLHGLVDVPYFKNDLAMMTWILLALFISPYVIPKNLSKKTTA
ncbi:MAG: O-antigen ligase family protein [Patescibacteria group bacterium]